MNLKTLMVSFFLFSFLLGGGLHATEVETQKGAKEEFKEAGHSLKEGFKKTGRKIKKGAKKTGRAFKEGGKSFKEEINKDETTH